MGWSIGWDESWQRDIGYGVPAYCDHPDCTAEIDRGLGNVCGGEPYGGEHGCGLFFCEAHLRAVGSLCERCSVHDDPFEPKPDHPDWIAHKLTDPSWQEWRNEHPKEVEAMRSVPNLPPSLSEGVSSEKRRGQ